MNPCIFYSWKISFEVNKNLETIFKFVNHAQGSPKMKWKVVVVFVIFGTLCTHCVLVRVIFLTKPKHIFLNFQYFFASFIESFGYFIEAKSLQIRGGRLFATFFRLGIFFYILRCFFRKKYYIIFIAIKIFQKSIRNSRHQVHFT